MTDLFIAIEEAEPKPSEMLPFVVSVKDKAGGRELNWWAVRRPADHNAELALGSLYAACFCAALERSVHVQPAHLIRIIAAMGSARSYGAMEVAFLEYIAVAARRGARG